MSTPGTLSTALAFLPAWWQETTDPAAFDSLFAGWVRAAGWRTAGFVWPAEGAPTVARLAPSGGPNDPLIPAELSDVVREVRGGETTVLFQTEDGSTRLYAPVVLPCRPLALVWAQLPPGRHWSDDERAYLVLSSKTMERSPATAAVVGSVIQPERLSERLSDAAVIAGRMAHDFDNILTGIIGFADLAIPLLPPGSQQQSFVSEIAKVGQRGIAFTQQLHQLSRSGQVQPTPGSVVATLSREESRLKPVMHASVRIEKDLPPNLPAVALDAGSLQIALGHLLQNAVEACTQGGTVRVSARTLELTETDAPAFLGNVGTRAHLLLTITDSGIGIKPEIKRRLFSEPFLTTKVRHRGLGLAVAYRIIAAHRGGLQIDSSPFPPTGTQVRVVLPLVAHRLPAVTEMTPPPSHPGTRADVVRAADSHATTVRG